MTMDMQRTRHLFALSLAMVAAAMPAAAEVAFNGELRLRPEFRDNVDFNKNTKDTQSFVGSRLRITGSGLAAEDVAVKFTLQDTRNWGDPATVSPLGFTDAGTEKVDIHEAFVDFQKFLNLPVSFRAGRQELAYGDQRLVGHLGWSNQGRAFDAFKLMYTANKFSIDAWTAKRQDNNAGAAGGRSSIDQDFSGVYAVLRAPVFFLDVLDLYALHDHEGNTTDDGNNFKPKNVYTFGARAAGKTGPLDYTVEAPFQTGDNGTVVGASSSPVKVSANALAVKAGWSIPGSKEIRIGAEYDYASGDDNASDTTSKTFQNLYHTNHLFYGYMDLQSWRNLSAWSVVGQLKPTRRTFFQAQYWDLSLAEEKDGWYPVTGGAATGALRGASALNTEKKIGSEIDLLFRFMQSRTITWEAGYGCFLPGSFIDKKIVNESSQDWLYLMLTTKF
jgi:hypothetical protein